MAKARVWRTLKIAEKVFSAENIRNRLTRYMNIRFEHNNKNEENLKSLSNLCETYNGDIILMLHMSTANKLNQRIQSNKYLVSSNQEFLDKLRVVFGKSNVWLS